MKIIKKNLKRRIFKCSIKCLMFVFLTVFFLYLEQNCFQNRPVQAQYLKNSTQTLFLEAEGFDDNGGWTVDQQFMDQLGSPVLLAHGFGTPVDNAKTEVIVKEAGIYRVFVRTRNWVVPWTPQYAPGVFQLIVNGVPNKTTFGNESDPWNWQQGENILIEHDNQKVLLELKDLTGFDGRLDAICLTKNANFVLPNNKEDLLPLRRQARGLPESPNDIPSASDKPFDLVVVGGGIPGVTSAITAAKLGLSAALIQDRPVLGGNGSAEIRVHLNGNINQKPYPNLGNLTFMLGPHGGGNAREAAHYKDQTRLELVKAEKNIQLFLNTHINTAELKPQNPASDQKIISEPAPESRLDQPSASRQIQAVIGENIETGVLTRFEGHLFVDCTGDGNLGFLAGADWRMGRESKAETGEAHALDFPDKMTMGASIQWNTRATGYPTAFPELPWAIQFTEESIRPMYHGDWDWEAGMNLDQIGDIERIRDIGLRAAYGHWAYMKNKMSGNWADTVRDREFAWVSFIAGKRESRRLLGDVILKEEDIVGQKDWPDKSVTTTWDIDLHYPEPENSRFFPGEEFRSIAQYVHVNPYAIPYRCFYSRNVDNLLMAGRNISVTHVGLGTVRVMRTGGMMGEVVGMAASVCRKENCLPRAVYAEHLDQLIELMKQGIVDSPSGLSGLFFDTIPDWLKKLDSKNSLAKKAVVTVSSRHENQAYKSAFINDGIVNIESNDGRWVSAPEELSWVQLDFEQPIVVNALRLFSGQIGSRTPIQDCVLQYQDEQGNFCPIQDAKISNNDSLVFGVQFKETKAKTFRLLITRTPGNLARLWELELFAL